jgi:glycine dehydrogenase subunit 1
VIATANERNILAGVPLGRWYPDMADCFLVAVTEKRTKEEIDALTHCLQTINEKHQIHA